MWVQLKRFMPKSLSKRALLIVVLPMLLVQALSSYMFYERHWKNVQKHMALALANEIAYIGARAENPHTREASFDMAAKYFGLYAEWQDGKSNENVAKAPNPYPELQQQLWEKLPYPFVVIDDPGDAVRVKILMPTGVLTILTSEKRFLSATTYIFLMWMNGSAVSFLIIALLFLRNQIRPIQQLAVAADAFGKGQDIVNFRPRGATEIRRAGQAFIVMSERIRRQITRRTQLLAAISHDLRTPLTRMKLQLAMLKDAGARAELGQDITEMELMIGEYLDFVRGEGGRRRVRCP